MLITNNDLITAEGDSTVLGREQLEQISTQLSVNGITISDVGKVTLSGAAGTPGLATVVKPQITAKSRIFVSNIKPDTANGFSIPSVVITPGVGFQIKSTANDDTSEIAWMLIEQG